MKAGIGFALILIAGCVAILGQEKVGVTEPQYNYVFHYVKPDQKLEMLEKHTPQISAKIRAFGYGGYRTSYEVMGAKSSVRFKAGHVAAMVVRGVPSTMDPTDIIFVIPLEVKKEKRHFVLSNSGVMGVGTKTKTVFANSLPFISEPYGTSSLKIVFGPTLPAGEYAVASTVSQHWYCFGIDPA